MKAASVEREIRRIQDGRSKRLLDQLVVEVHYRVFVGEEEIAARICTPGCEKDMAVGILALQGRIHSAQAVSGLCVQEGRIDIKLQAETCPPTRRALYSLSSAFALRLFAKFMVGGPLFCTTGGTHACAAISTPNAAVEMVLREDISRRAAAEKLVGALLRQGKDPTCEILLFSGRMSAELMEQFASCGFRMILCGGAVSLAAAEIAAQHDITLAGFIRGNRLNLYAEGACRITL